jgi:hypothetical protein
MQEEPPQRHTGLEETRADMQRWTECVRDLQELVKQRIHKEYLLASDFESSKPEEHTTILHNLCIVEGFLLYSDPNMADSSDTKEGFGIGSTDIDTPTVPSREENVEAPAKNISISHATDKTDDHLHGGPERLSRPQDTLMDLFDMKLFLPTSKDVAKRRRFSRKPYIDHPSGYRMGGQYWKTEGYFENVAWPNYQRLHQWLLLDGTTTGSEEDLGDVGDLVKAISPEAECIYWKKGDVHVREMDAGVEETLRWAVEIILAKMA